MSSKLSRSWSDYCIDTGDNEENLATSIATTPKDNLVAVWVTKSKIARPRQISPLVRKIASILEIIAWLITNIFGSRPMPVVSSMMMGMMISYHHFLAAVLAADFFNATSLPPTAIPITAPTAESTSNFCVLITRS